MIDKSIKITIVILGIFFTVALSNPVGAVSGEFGDPADATMTYTITGADFSYATDSNRKWVGHSKGGPITISGEMTVTRPEGFVSEVAMTAYLGWTEKWKWPPDGESNRVKGRTVSESFSLTYTPNDNEPNVVGGAKLRICGGSCYSYYVDLFVYPLNADTFGEAAEPTTTTTTTIPEGCGKNSGTIISDVSGMVMMFPEHDPDDTYPVEVGMRVPSCYHIITHDDSNVLLSFADMTSFYMKPNSEVIIMKRPPRQSNFMFKMGLVLGDIKVNFKRMFTDQSMDVVMNQAVAGIKGTTLVLHDDGVTSSVKVTDGVVNFKSLATGEVVDVSAGQTVSATANGLSEIQSFDVEAEEATWNEFETEQITGGEPESTASQTMPQPTDTAVDKTSSEGGSNKTLIALVILVIAASAILFSKKLK